MGSVSHHQLPDLLNFIYFLFFLPTLTGYHPESIICIKVQSWWCGFYGFRQMYNDVYRHYSMMKHGFIAPRTTLLSIHKLEDAMSTSPSISIDNTSFLPTRLSAWLQYTYKQTKYFTEVKGMWSRFVKKHCVFRTGGYWNSWFGGSRLITPSDCTRNGTAVVRILRGMHLQCGCAFPCADAGQITESYILYYAATLDRQLIFFPVQLFISQHCCSKNSFCSFYCKAKSVCYSSPGSWNSLWLMPICKTTLGGNVLFSLLSDLPKDITVNCRH